MESIKITLSNPKNRPAILIAVAAIIVLCCCCVIVAVAVVLALRPAGLPITSRNETPPYYGVFVNQDGGLVEIQETEIFDLPTQEQMADVQMVIASRPEIIVWRMETNLDYLALYKLGQFINEQEEINFNATSDSDGVIKITPTASLDDGVYCLVQGDPMSAFLPGWCFRIGASK